MSECRIRAAGRADLAAVLALYVAGGLDRDTLGPAEAEALFERIGRYPDYHLYVAEQAGTLVGSFALLIMDNLAHLGAPSAIIEDFVVAPGARRRGVGRAMIAHALERARQRRCYKLMLSSAAQRDEAHAFYAALGFERHGTSWLIRP